MPAIQFYAAEDDFIEILDFLNKDVDIAFIVNEKPKSFKAVETLTTEQFNSEFIIWHTSASLPKQSPKNLSSIELIEWNKNPEIIEEPFLGWEYEGLTHKGFPNFNNSPAIIQFEKTSMTDTFENGETIAQSSFSWVGNYFSIMGSKPDPVVQKWWNRFKRTIKKLSVQITNPAPRQNEFNPKPYIYLLPAALSAHKAEFRNET